MKETGQNVKWVQKGAPAVFCFFSAVTRVNRRGQEGYRELLSLKWLLSFLFLNLQAEKFFLTQQGVRSGMPSLKLSNE